ncbi:MAG: ROK family transcriptional regulator [Bacteroidetes bacterium]|nr:ROK family transcriptional regulator [Bacteroidota bacterium]
MLQSIKRPRIINTSRIIREIWSSPQVSRVEIARRLQLNKSTITNIVSELIEDGLVQETNEGFSGPQGGRKPVNLQINKQYGVVIGFELRPNSYTVVVTDLFGDILFSQTELDSISNINFKEKVFSIYQKTMEKISWIDTPVLGVGFGISGIIDAHKRVIKASIPLEFTKPFDFYEEIAKDFPVPVFIENDANSCAWGELVFHRFRSLRNFLFILVEFRDLEERKKIYEKTAVGLGFVIDGKVYYGLNSSAGEFHSVFIGKDQKGQFDIDYEASFTIEENPEVLKKFITELSKHAALFVNSLNLSQVFIGGHIEKYQEIVRPILLKEINRNWMYEPPVDCEIRFSSLGERAVAYGAAGFVLDRLFIDLEFLDDNDMERVGGLFLLPDLKKRVYL